MSLASCRNLNISTDSADEPEEKVIIYRNLHCYDGSSIYEGHPIEDNIANCLISPKTGEIVFDGEHDTLVGKIKK